MDPRAERQALRAHLARARAASEDGRPTDALAEITGALAIDPQCLAAHALREQLLSPAPAGAVPTDARRPVASGSGVPADGWMRFEARARERHVERRAAAARAAIGQGRLDESREAIAEIREIDPVHPVLETLGRELDLATRTAVRRPSRAWRRAAVALFVAAAGAGGWLIGPRLSGLMSASRARMPAAPPPVAARQVETVGNQPDVLEPPRQLARVPEQIPAGYRLDDLIEPAVERPPDLVARSEPARVASGVSTRAIILPNPRPSASSARAPLPSSPPPTASVAQPPAAPLPAQVRQEPAPISSVPATAPRSTATTGTVAPSVEVPRSPRTVEPPLATSSGAVVVPNVPRADVPSRESDEVLVRRTLQQFRAAYDALDAEAAREAWPGVDSVALQRAFDGLHSQHLTFDTCDVRVSGALGTATCRGSARYVPRIGSREPRVESRTWTFVLRRSGDAWRIDSTRVEQ